MTKNERLKAARLKSGKSQREIAASIGSSQAYIAALEKGQAFSFDKAKEISQLIGIDAETLYYGDKTERELSSKSNFALKENKGDKMTLSDIAVLNSKLTYGGKPAKTQTVIPIKAKKDEAPYLENVNASAGLNFLVDNGDTSTYIKIPGAGVDAYINVFGDSMYPKYCAGEIIGVKEVQKDDLFFGHAFVIQMSDGEAYIKYIQPGKDEDHWSLESENPKYPARQFHLSKITKIFKIRATITKNSL